MFIDPIIINSSNKVVVLEDKVSRFLRKMRFLKRFQDAGIIYNLYKYMGF